MTESKFDKTLSDIANKPVINSRIKPKKENTKVKTFNSQQTKSIIETLKTITIVFLVTAVTFFILGMSYANDQHKQTKSEIDTQLKQTAKLSK